MTRILLLAVFICAALALQAQKIRTRLSGTIADARTGLPLAGASVLLADSHTGTTTDSTGHYVLENIPSGHTLLEISYAGYRTQVVHLDISNNDVHDFALTPTMLENEGVTVTAVANATSIRKAPIAITRVSRGDLLSQPSTNIIDALSRQPGISQISTGPAISKPIIRGLGYNRLVVINDGIRQEGQQWGDEHGIEIDENSVSRVEIVKGPASLIYGSDAIAGVINIVTTAPVPVNTLQGSLMSEYQTNNRQRALFGSLGGNRKGFNWNAWGDLRGAADYRNRYDGRVFNSKFNEHNFGGYAGINQSWGYSHLILSRFSQELGIIEGERDAAGHFVRMGAGGTVLPVTQSDFETAQPDVPFQTIDHLKLISDNSFRAGSGRLSLTLGWQQNHRKEFGNADAPRDYDLFFDLHTVNYNLMYHFAERKGWTTSLGLNGMAQQNANRGAEVLIPEYRLFDIGSFVYTQKTVGKTTLSGGVRYDRRRLHSEAYTEGGSLKFAPFEKTFSNASGSAGLSYAATDNMVVRFNLATGFRAPSIPELASNGAHEGTNRYEYGDRGLQSERSLQSDLGLELTSDHVRFTASAFYNRINHFIFYSKLRGSSGGDSLVEVNGSFIPAFRFSQQDATLAGAEALLDLHPHPLDWLHWQNTFSYVRGRFTHSLEGERDLPFVPAPRWISELRGEFLSKGKHLRNLTAHVELDHSFAQQHAFTLYGTETPTQAYTLLNAGLSLNVVRRNQTLFSLYLNGSNLGDVAYQNHLSRLKYTDVNPVTGRTGVFNMGRNFSVRVNLPLRF